MNDQIQNETPEDREKRIRAEVDKLTEGKTHHELTSMLTNAIAGVGLQSDLQWLHAFNPNSVSVAIPNGATGETTRSSIIPSDSITASTMVPKLIEFRDEFEATLASIEVLSPIQKKANGKFRQTLGNVILWYGQWERNKDYSSAINASLALGKLSTATDFIQSLMPEEDAEYYIGIVATVEALCSECWEHISDACGRIVPFERG